MRRSGGRTRQWSTLSGGIGAPSKLGEARHMVLSCHMSSTNSITLLFNFFSGSSLHVQERWENSTVEHIARRNRSSHKPRKSQAHGAFLSQVFNQDCNTSSQLSSASNSHVQEGWEDPTVERQDTSPRELGRAGWIVLTFSQIPQF